MTEHGSNSIELRKKLYLIELNRSEENSTRYQPFIMYKLFENEVDSL